MLGANFYFISDTGPTPVLVSTLVVKYNEILISRFWVDYLKVEVY